MKITVGQARTIINLHKLGHSVKSINYMSNHPISLIEYVIRGIKQ